LVAKCANSKMIAPALPMKMASMRLSLAFMPRISRSIPSYLIAQMST
jgi:hypothetical protein